MRIQFVLPTTFTIDNIHLFSFILMFETVISLDDVIQCYLCVILWNCLCV